jgi:DNA-binding beta-propeller fold protein YncE
MEMPVMSFVTTGRLHRWMALVLFVLAATSVTVMTQRDGAPQGQRVVTNIDPFAYDVVPNWSLPYPRANEGYTWGSVPGIFVENDDRIFIASRGEIKLPNPLPADYLGFFGSLNRSALNAPENEVTGCLRVVDSNGKVLELWSQWDKLFAGTNGPHKIRISPYDPQHRVWVVGETKSVIYVFSNDGKQLLQTLGEEGVAAADDKHFGRPQDVDFLPDGSVLVADGLTNSRIVKLDRNGRFVMAWGTRGAEDGQFNAVHGVAVDRNRHVYVADRANKRVQVFDENGKHLATWPNIRFPNHVFVSDATQDVWVADNMTAEVLKYDTNGNRLFSWNASGPVPGGFGELHQFSVDSKGNVYTADNVLGRPQKLTPKRGADPKQLIGRSVALTPRPR